MDLLDKNIQLIGLYDLYQNVLTEKQREYFELYYFDDLSITEISENLNVSRNAVHDQIKRTTQKLFDLEEKLQIQENNKKRNKLLKKLESKTSDQEMLDIIDLLKKVE